MARTASRQHDHVRHPAVVALNIAIDKRALTGSDAQFASDLCEKAARWGASPKQMEWIEKLLARANGTEPQPARETVALSTDLSAITALFAKAGEVLRAPKVALHVAGIGEVHLTVAGSAAKHPGSINVATPGGYGNNTWFGRITRAGQFEKSPRASSTTALVSILQAFAADPAKVAAEHGKLMGKCCFCIRPLKDARSTEVGYGPVCASRFGLAWG